MSLTVMSCHSILGCLMEKCSVSSVRSGAQVLQPPVILRFDIQYTASFTPCFWALGQSVCSSILCYASVEELFAFLLALQSGELHIVSVSCLMLFCTKPCVLYCQLFFIAILTPYFQVFSHQFTHWLMQRWWLLYDSESAFDMHVIVIDIYK